jgi:hypothetical protein
MPYRRTARLAALVAALAPALLAACSSATAGGGRDEPALIRFGEQTARVDVPEAVAVGAVVPVTVVTFGGGCVRDAARAQVAPAPQSNGGEVAVRLFNRNTGADVCTDDLRYIEHRVAVPAAVAGPLVLRIEGANRGAETGWQTVPWVITRIVVVR